MGILGGKLQHKCPTPWVPYNLRFFTLIGAALKIAASSVSDWNPASVEKSHGATSPACPGDELVATITFIPAILSEDV
jgi:hypothetical protein